MHDEQRLIAFLAGDLPADEAAAVDEHLLTCDECWAAVRADRDGRRQAEELRELAPSDLRDRVRFAIEGAAGEPARRRRRLAMPVIAALTAVAFAITAVTLARQSSPHDPPAIRAVLAVAARVGEDRPVPAEVRADGATLLITAYRVSGHRVLVARAADPFPMPAGARPLSADHRGPWVAHRDIGTVLCVNHPQPALLVGDLDPGQLTELARALYLA